MLIQIIAYWIIGFPLGYSLGATQYWGENYGIYGFWTGFLAGIMVAAGLLSSRLYLRTRRVCALPEKPPQVSWHGCTRPGRSAIPLVGGVLPLPDNASSGFERRVRQVQAKRRRAPP